MIAPRELRLENKVLRNGIVVTVDNQTFWDLEKYPDQYEPIELSEDWLLKFGFESNNVVYKIDNDRFIFELYFYDAWDLNYVEKQKFGNGSAELSGYWKIHELQNIFFALTWEELTIK
ncbi:MAG TPA: hypothetical protein DCQ68_01875 [Chryseobacterium indologenes]|nr:hypothetical protein [Chryseobacterium indologenes]